MERGLQTARRQTEMVWRQGCRWFGAYADVRSGCRWFWDRDTDGLKVDTEGLKMQSLVLSGRRKEEEEEEEVEAESGK